MEPVVDRLQITVRDLSVAEPFYDQLMPLLGFVSLKRGTATIAEHEIRVVEYQHPRLAFAITSPRAGFAADAVHRRRPESLHHLAFRAGSRAEVDALHVELQRIGATIVTPPRTYPEYMLPGYYAVFFKDPDGMEYEVMHTPPAAPAPPALVDAGEAPRAASGSPALTALQAKLRGFQTLVARGDLAKAAVIASDLRAVLASFDPLVYFPSMFASYFEVLNAVVDQLEPYFDSADQPSWHELESVYRVDLQAFLDD